MNVNVPETSRFSNPRTSTVTMKKSINGPKVPDNVLPIKWTLDDREQLKKYLMTFGYGRWNEIQEASSCGGGRLKDKTISEIRLFANTFLSCIIENLSFDNEELRDFLSSIIQEDDDDPYIIPNSKDWDPNLIRQKAQPWGKRIQLLYRITTLIKQFEEQQLKEENSQIEIKWENILNFLPKSAFYGQRPSAWWTKKHDIDLLRGTYMFGYANYNRMRNHHEFSFKDLEQPNSFVEFPSADAITRRLKKIVHTIARAQQNDGKIDFDAQENAEKKELEEWTTEEKVQFYRFISNYDVSLTAEGKPNWQDVKEKYQNFMGATNLDKTINDVEKLVSKIKIKCAQIINLNLDYMELEDDELADLKVTAQEAQKFTKNSNMLFFIRKTVLSNNHQVFKNATNDLIKRHEELKKDDLGFLPGKYDPEKQDLSLLLYLSENGLSNLEKLSNNSAFNFEGYQLNAEQVIQRLEFLCEFFKNFIEKTSSKKRKIEKNPRDEGKRPKFQITRDENGNIVFPIYIHSSLTLLNHGQIHPHPSYHTEYNLFPVGFKSVRNHASMFHQGQRADYTCEILEGSDGRPIYRVTSSEDPENPIVRDSSTGCWVYVCNRVNQVANIKKPKVTISGTERFGLLETNVVRILEHLPGAEKCHKYKFKFRAQENVEAI